MGSGEVGLGTMGNGNNARAELAGNAAQLAYAGPVTFETGVVQRYDDRSGTYLPNGALRFQSGFGDARGFADAATPAVPPRDAAEGEAVAETVEALLRRQLTVSRRA